MILFICIVLPPFLILIVQQALPWLWIVYFASIPFSAWLVKRSYRFGVDMFLGDYEYEEENTLEWKGTSD
jgi:hypothetical protein